MLIISIDILAKKELTKRIETSTTAPAGLLETLTPLLYRISVIIYNKSHVPAIMEFSKSDDKSLSTIAHEVLRDISSRTPEVLKAHIQEICRTLEEEAPTPKKANNPGAAENLKACASFAAKFAKEIPHDRKFVQAMTGFAIFGSPPEAAKYAVSIIMATSDKKELLARDLVKRCVKEFQYGGNGFLSRLATLSQLMLLAPNEVDEESDAVIDIAIKQILLQVQTETTDNPVSYMWSNTVDVECEAKCWALKILVNRVRSHPTLDTLSDVAAPVYNLLSTLIAQDGEISTAKTTPATHKPRLRLLAARLFLKLCTKKPHDALFTPNQLNSLAVVAQDSEAPVRSGFLQRLKKYLAQQKLPQRFYTIPFLLAFEPIEDLKLQTTTWIRSRVVFFSSLKSQTANSVNSNRPAIVMESVFARLLSLLTHHPDYESTSEDLIDFSRYIIFYLQNVATEENLSLIYHIAQRVKQCRDAVVPRKNSADSSIFDSNLYHLSDLAQLTIRKFEDAHSWTVQTLPAKIRLPTSLFAEIDSHDEAQHIAERNYLPDGVEEGVESLVRASMRAGRSSKKRKSEGDIHEGAREHKKPKALPIRKANVKEKRVPKTGATVKTPKKKAHNTENATKISRGEESNERRRSGRVKLVGDKSYAEREDEEDDDEMEVLEWEYIGGEPNPEEEDEEEDEEGAEDEEAGDDADNPEAKGIGGSDGEDEIEESPSSERLEKRKRKPTPTPTPTPTPPPAPSKAPKARPTRSKEPPPTKKKPTPRTKAKAGSKAGAGSRNSQKGKRKGAMKKEAVIEMEVEEEEEAENPKPKHLNNDEHNKNEDEDEEMSDPPDSD